MTRLCEKRDAGEVDRGGEHIALAANQRSAESRIEKVFLLQFQSHNFPGLRAALARTICHRISMLPRDYQLGSRAADRESRHDRVAILGFLEIAFGIQTGHEAILDFVSIGENVAFVELQNICEVVYAGHKAIHGTRLDDMLPLSAQELFIE